ncbi:MAG: hypothetical protein E7426_04380 [Ruminococcaceae bacterium]|nr:hypothetical protein [Oscillospiraceae bacterium]
MLTKREKSRLILALLCWVPVLVCAADGAVRQSASGERALLPLCALGSGLFLLAACSICGWYQLGILLGRRFHLPSWAQVLQYFAVCSSLAALLLALVCGAPLLCHNGLLLICPLSGAVSLLLADRSVLQDRRLPLLATLAALPTAGAALALTAAGAAPGPYPLRSCAAVSLPQLFLWAAADLLLALASAWGLRALDGLLRGAAAPVSGPAEEQGWSDDGYIVNQDCFSAYTYRAIPASYNSCGCVAVFDLRRRAGHAVSFPDVLAEMDALHLLRVPGPTRMYAMRRYLTKYLPGWRECRGRVDALDAAGKSRMGLFRYREQRVPHFVPYYRTGPDRFRFFNVCGGSEDRFFTLDEFAAGHLVEGPVRILYWPEA